MAQPPMAFMHLDGVTPEWVFNCTKGFGLPHVVSGKLHALHINETRAPVYPVPRPRITWVHADKMSKNPFGTWNTDEVAVEVVTCLNEYACQLERELGVTRSDDKFLSLATNGSFCTWWQQKVS